MRLRYFRKTLLSAMILAPVTSSLAVAETSHLTFGAEISAGNGIEISGHTATITHGGRYIISGHSENAQLIVDTGDAPVELELSDLDLSYSQGAPIFIRQAGDVDILFTPGAEISLADSADFKPGATDEKQTSVIYSKSDLKIIGAPNAKMHIQGRNNDGIVSKDDLNIENANIDITAVDDGIRGKDSVALRGSTLVIRAKGDSIKSDNTETKNGKLRGVITIEETDIDVNGGDDGIRAANAIDIISGHITLIDVYEGIEAKKIDIYGGDITVRARDDGINISEKTEGGAKQEPPPFFGFGERRGGGGGHDVLEGGLLTIHGGSLDVVAGGDGLDSNGNALMSGGVVTVSGPLGRGDSALDMNGDFTVSGGTLIALGGSGMLSVPSAESGQPCLQVFFPDIYPEGTKVTLQTLEGETLLERTSVGKFQAATLSSADLIQGDSYQLLLDGKLYEDITLDQQVTLLGEPPRRGRGGPPGGPHDGRPRDGEREMGFFNDAPPRPPKDGSYP